MSKLAEANAQMAEGDKAASSGFFKKPNWALSASCYAKAALAFKLTKEKDACVAAHKRAAEAFAQTEGGLFHAAKHLESAAKESDKPHVAKELLVKAAGLFRENGNHEKGAQCLGDAASKAEEAHLLDEAVELYRQSIEINEGEGRTDSKLLGALLACLIKTGNLHGACKQCDELCGLWLKKNNFAEAHRLVNSQIVLRLHMQDAVAAERVYSSALADVPGYIDCDAAKYANELLDAIKNSDATALAALKQSSKFRYLETVIVKLFRDLQVGAAVQGGEEDLT